MEPELDLVLVGATGFVGRLTAAHLATAAPDGARIALAARSLPRLEQLRDTLPEHARRWPLIEVDATDPDAARALAVRTTALATAVGPYASYGFPLVAACAGAGTHYADLTGEVLFVRRTIEELHDRASMSGARIVHACGFDSVPSDLGVWLTAQRAQEDGAGGLTDTELVVRRLRGGLSGGTIDSMRQQVIASRGDADAKAVLADREALSGGGARRSRGEGEAAPSATPRHTPSVRGRGLGPVRQDAVTGRWRVPFFMGGFNGPIVRRSHALAEGGYGPHFRYRELQDTGRGVRGAVRGLGTMAALGGVGAGLAFGPTRAVLDRVLPAPGEGPAAEQRARGGFTMEVTAGTESGARYRTTVGADLDPGYEGTAVMFGQAALALAAGEGAGAGVLTPAVGLGEALVERLRAHGFTLETLTLP
ncbi:saccharopine dehydrogenase NADP-binding domain-containing protein [Ornithinimicrobium sp. F0845]|uniref:saccharopine dehydrogenase family protein n=1 Tax=Ornithinimicrobium sp. F0845 TaxID=2926412 RepID=UPI001FF6B442|nr:saccharopine dehydrogenase NADP-binding domain-containing protein [Ornithinimicrobium sp. F0845]MCK0113599.1 saccharopine dehydrogenase NADP-binding domain-containing protein [Ornithinimicrobium sp. F0845]